VTWTETFSAAQTGLHDGAPQGESSMRAVIVPHDWRDSPAWEEFVRDDAALVLGFYYDSIPAFRGKKMAVHSTSYVVLEILNLPFYLRADPRFTLLSDIVPGPKKPVSCAPWLLPAMRDLIANGITVLFASADYEAHVALLSHKSLGYWGCTKCEQKSERHGDFFDWGIKHTLVPPRRKTGRRAVLDGQNAVRLGLEHVHGFKKEPVVARMLDDCIVQSPEDALHLLEGCLKNHLFRLLGGKKDVADPGQGRRWEEWLRQLEKIKMKPWQRRVFDRRWRQYCRLTGRTCSASPFQTPGSMTGEDWYTLALCGEWIFQGLIEDAKLLEYCVTLCTIFRLLAAPIITPRLTATLDRLETVFQRLHVEVMPPIARPLVFHRIGHLIQDVKKFGPMFRWWTFRNERYIGQLMRTLRRKNDIESHVEANIIRNKLGRFLTGTQVKAQADLEWLQDLEPVDVALSHPENVRRKAMTEIAAAILRRRERTGTRLNLVKHPETSPLRVVARRATQQEEKDAVRSRSQSVFASICDLFWT